MEFNIRQNLEVATTLIKTNIQSYVKSKTSWDHRENFFFFDRSDSFNLNSLGL